MFGEKPPIRQTQLGVIWQWPYRGVWTPHPWSVGKVLKHSAPASTAIANQITSPSDRQAGHPKTAPCNQ